MQQPAIAQVRDRLPSPLGAAVYFGDMTDGIEYWNLRTPRLDNLSPEKELLLVTLIDAAITLKKLAKKLSKSGRDERLYNDTQRWFRDKKFGSVFSFRNICQSFDIVPETILKKLEAYL